MAAKSVKFVLRVDTAEEELRSIYVHQEVIQIQLIVNLEPFSNWNRALRGTAYGHRFIKNTRAEKRRNEAVFGILTQAELTFALEYLTRTSNFRLKSLWVDRAVSTSYHRCLMTMQSYVWTAEYTRQMLQGMSSFQSFYREDII